MPKSLKPDSFHVTLIVAFIGTLLLLFLSQHLEPQVAEIKNIGINDMDNFVKIHGNITKFEDRESTKVLDVNDGSGNISIVIFSKNILTIKKGMQIEIIGKVSEYNNEMQINAEKIREIK